MLNGRGRYAMNYCGVNGALFPKISDCKYASGTFPTMTDSPIKISVVTAKFFVFDGITILISAMTLR